MSERTGLLDVRRGADGASGDGQPVTLETSGGEIVCRYHWAPGSTRAVLWVGGAGGGLDGPAGRLYPALADLLASNHQIASLRLHYRRPNDLNACVSDTLLGMEWLRQEENIERIALVGHSFGGAVVIAAGARSPAVGAVAPLSSQTYGAQDVDRLAPRPILFLHGACDTILPAACSESLYARAGQPKTIKIYPGAGHGLDECRADLIVDLGDWLVANT